MINKMEWCGNIKTKISVLFVFLVCFFVLLTSPVSTKEIKAPDYVVNLDLPPEQRWNHLVLDFKYLLPQLHKVLRTFIPSEILPLVEKVAASIDELLPAPYAAEIRGIAKAAECNEGDVVITNLVYDLTVFCTSIVAQDKQGVIWHGRNLDYHLTDLLRNITVNVHFQRNNKTVYTSTTYAGYIGVLTGQKPQVFTVSVDERRVSYDWWLNALVALLDWKSSLMSFLVRDTLESAVSFDDAMNRLSTTDIISPVYYIVGGTKPGEGAIITRDRLKARDIWKLNTKANRWYLVETNYDHWLPVPKGDDRRHTAEKAMNRTGQGHINEKTMYEVLSVNPVLNVHTTYTTIMSASQPHVYNTMIRKSDFRTGAWDDISQ